jgi:tripeptidyl-peptidase-1
MLSLLAGGAAVPVALATSFTPRWDYVRVKHSWPTTPAKWEHHDNPPAGATIDLHVLLKPHRENALINALNEVSDPNHQKYVSSLSYLHNFTFIHGYIHSQRRYGAHLSKEQVDDLVAPHPDALDLVGSWLEYHKVPSSFISSAQGGGWLTLSGVPVSQANALLSASYQLYRHAETNETVLRTTSYVLPHDLHDHIQTVVPTTYFGSLRTPQGTPQPRPDEPTRPGVDLKPRNELVSLSPDDSPVSANCSKIISPTCLRKLYKTEGYEPRATGSNQLGITGYLGDSVSRSDLKEFLRVFRPDAVHPQLSIVNVNGGTNDENNPNRTARILLSMSVYISCNHTG